MRTALRGTVVTVLLLASAQVAGATCASRRCTDLDAVTAVRERIASECDVACRGTSPREYLRCVKDILKDAADTGALAGACKGTVKRCEARSTCGRPGAVACCQVSGRGRVKARIVASASRCRGGSVCAGVRSAMDACTEAGTCTGPAGTFASIQEVFSQSCAFNGCHSAVSRQGGLVLDSEEVSYQNLVDQPSEHVDARATGLLRVKSGDPGASFLVRKLRGLGPGESMPQGFPPLPGALVTLIEDWIRRGAHETAEECPVAAPNGILPAHAGDVQNVCDAGPIDFGTYKWRALPALKRPSRRRGIQLRVPPREVEPGTEWETCYAFRPDWTVIGRRMGMPEGQLPSIKRQVYRMHEGSHHLLLYAYFGQEPEAWPEGFFPCVAANCINPGDCPSDAGTFTLPIGGTQVAGTRYEVRYPDGVGLPVLGPNTVLIANLHYTNPFRPAQRIRGEAWLNLEFYRPGEFKVLLDGIFAVNFRDLIVEPFETRTISRIWQPRSILTRQPVDAAVFQLFGHMHKRGTLFQIDYVKGGRCSVSGALCGRDDDCRCRPYETSCQPGQTCERGPDAEDTPIYHTTQWDNAPVIDFTPPYLHVNRDQGLRWTCTHVNGVAGDPDRPPKRCHEGCNSCGWDPATRTCTFDRGITLGVDTAPRTYREGDPMPVVFGELADDDMCNMFGYFIPQEGLAALD
jgi:hypothetical protein